jgi:seryl-tRNA synthetase
VYILNASGRDLGVTLIAILENRHRADGAVMILEVRQAVALS